MECTWVIGDENGKKLEEVNLSLLQKLDDAHEQMKADRDAKITSMSVSLERPTDEDLTMVPIEEKLDTTYYDETLKGVVETTKLMTEQSRILEERRQSRRHIIGDVGKVIAGGAITLIGMAFLDRCEKREDTPTQPSRHPGFKLLGKKF